MRRSLSHPEYGSRPRGLRRLAEGAAWSLVLHRLEEASEEFLRASAWVVVPHQDDEVLGCGGTLIRKRLAGADVRIACLTDGSRSHVHPGGAEVLREMRRNEARAAGESLGISADRLHFLDFTDGELMSNVEPGAEKLRHLLQQHPARQLFLPYRRDEHPDHLATHRIALLAARALDRRVELVEYATWFWLHWPWVPLRSGTLRSKLGFLRHSASLLLDLFREFRQGVPIHDQLAGKRAALSAHRSQMVRFAGRDDWIILADYAGGSWLDCFFREYEVFRCHSIG